MSLAVIISLATVVIWFFPLFKQSQTEYFYYFSIHALSGPTMLFAYLSFHVITNYWFISIYLLLLSALAGKKHRYYLIPLAVIMFPVSTVLHLSRELIFSLSAVVDLFILIALLDVMFKSFARTQQINLLRILIVVYTLIDFAKLVDGAISIDAGMVSFYLGLIAQMFFCAAFCFINVNTKNFKVRVKVLEDM
jgi:hypothetical protein